MVETELMIQNQMGLHARAAAKFVHTATRFQSQVFVSRDELEVNGKSIMGVMMLAAEQGAIIRVRAEGPDAEAAIEALRQLVNGKFEEP